MSSHPHERALSIVRHKISQSPTLDSLLAPCELTIGFTEGMSTLSIVCPRITLHNAQRRIIHEILLDVLSLDEIVSETGIQRIEIAEADGYTYQWIAGASDRFSRCPKSSDR